MRTVRLRTVAIALLTVSIGMGGAPAFATLDDDDVAGEIGAVTDDDDGSELDEEDAER